MKILILMGQRKEDYEGQYAPEALACMSEYDNSDNPDYLREQRDMHAKSGEFDALQVVTLNVDGRSILDALYPARKPIHAVVAEYSQ